MNLSELAALLKTHPEKGLRPVLPDGTEVPAEFHVTEVGHVTKRFVDCGGAVRSTESCVLQTWVAENDATHRLTAGKLAKILALAGPVLPAHDLPVEIEHEAGVISQYPIEGYTMDDREIVLTLGRKHTDCLAKETCGIAPGVTIGARIDKTSGCGCGPTGCC